MEKRNVWHSTHNIASCKFLDVYSYGHFDLSELSGPMYAVVFAEFAVCYDMRALIRISGYKASTQHWRLCVQQRNKLGHTNDH